MRDNKSFVIFVDDSPSAREMVETGFEEAGYALETATGVVDLESRVLARPEAAKQVDLFIFDFEMPCLTGTQIAAAIDRVYKELKDTPFVIFSGRPRAEVEKAIAETRQWSKTFARNFRGYVEKQGESVEELLNQVGKVLNK